MRKQRGAKLLEMVIVMAIICILMASYLPALVSAKRKAKDTANMLSSPQRFVAAAPEEFTYSEPVGVAGPPVGVGPGDTTPGPGGYSGGPIDDWTNKGKTEGKRGQSKSALSPY